MGLVRPYPSGGAREILGANSAVHRAAQDLNRSISDERWSHFYDPCGLTI